jgi:hypothetical protein
MGGERARPVTESSHIGPYHINRLRLSVSEPYRNVLYPMLEL